MKNKAQLKIQEMSFMLVAVILFFTLVGLFVFSIIYSNLYNKANEINEEKGLSSIINLANSPEFNCIEQKPNCIDSDKLIVLTNKSIYKNFWDFSSLKIIKESGFNKKNLVKCSKINYPNCDKFVIYDKQVEDEKSIASFVALCRKNIENNKVYDKCEIAKIIAGIEIKTKK